MEDKNQNQGIITRYWRENGLLSLLEYEEAGGLEALKSVLTGKVTPEDVIEELEQSGLVGRGGGGFSTGKKWRLGLSAAKKAKPPEYPAESHAYFICNADESEPGTYKDRAIIENSPYLALEGLIIGAWVLGAGKGYIYINNGYKETTHALRKAIKLMEDAHWLGENIRDSGWSFHLEIFEGAGSYVCGEETALINSIEGKRGEPRLRPPFPAEKGLFGRPTVVNNVETLANVPYILDSGASAYLTRGKSEDTPGTKLFIINGRVKNPGVYEAPMGTSINELIDNYAIGMDKGQELRCVQVGGSAGALYAGEDLDQPLGYGGDSSLPMGSGTLLVIDKNTDLKRLLLSWAHFFRRESCGKCAPCREGTYQLYLIAERIARGKIMPGDRERIKDLVFTMRRASFCPLGSFAVNGWESLLKKFPDEIFS